MFRFEEHGPVNAVSHQQGLKDLFSDVDIQKQPPEVFCKNKCSYKFPKIHRKAPGPEYLFE